MLKSTQENRVNRVLVLDPCSSLAYRSLFTSRNLFTPRKQKLLQIEKKKELHMFKKAVVAPSGEFRNELYSLYLKIQSLLLMLMLFCSVSGEHQRRYRLANSNSSYPKTTVNFYFRPKKTGLWKVYLIDRPCDELGPTIKFEIKKNLIHWRNKKIDKRSRLDRPGRYACRCAVIYWYAPLAAIHIHTHHEHEKNHSNSQRTPFLHVLSVDNFRTLLSLRVGANQQVST